MALSVLFSGLVHWAADTWGTLDTPVVGKTLLRSFREHHINPVRMTEHDLIEANGDNCMAVVPALSIFSFIPLTNNLSTVFIVSFLLSTAFWVSLTNQFHKFAHTKNPGAFITFLQNIGFILSKKNHNLHHHNPFDRYYCITTGWLNPILGSIGFWKRMESGITHTFGAVPREDDFAWTSQSTMHIN